jgi:hypothetical protein
MEQKRTIIEVWKRQGRCEFRFKPLRKPKGLSGHRFVKLLGLDKWSTNLSILLDLYGLSPFVENPYTVAGQLLEEPIIKMVSDDYTMYGFDEETRGDMFFTKYLFGEKEIPIVGLIDAHAKDLNKLLEIKTFVNPRKIEWNGGKAILPREWFLQARFYLHWWNKTREQQGRDAVDGISVVAYKTNMPLINYIFEYRQVPKLNPNDLVFFDIIKDNGDGFEGLIGIACENLIKVTTLDEDGWVTATVETKGKKEKEQMEEYLSTLDTNVVELKYVNQFLKEGEEWIPF